MLSILVDDGVKDLIEILAVLEKRLAQDAFRNRAQLLQGAPAPPVPERRARLEPMDAQPAEDELERECGRLEENARAPVGGSERKSPLGGPEIRLELANLDDSDRRVLARQHDREADLPG
jgi:hypothetical protein